MKIKYALGFKDTVPYTEGNENKVLDKMKKQVSEIDGEDFVETKKKFCCVCMIFACIFGTVALYVIEAGIGIFTVFSLISIVFVASGIGSIIKMMDYKKNKRFIDIEGKLNSKVRENENMLVNTSRKTRNMVNSTPENKPVFNINNFSFIPNRDLNQIMDNIDRNDYFNFEYETVQDKPKTRTRKPNNKNRD